MSDRVSISNMPRAIFRLNDYLQQYGLSTYRLAMQVDRSHEKTVYRLARVGTDVKRIDVNVLADIVGSLRELTGEPVTFNDLLEYVPDN